MSSRCPRVSLPSSPPAWDRTGFQARS
jgi:hypothetical protein